MMFSFADIEFVINIDHLYGPVCWNTLFDEAVDTTEISHGGMVTSTATSFVNVVNL